MKRILMSTCLLFGLACVMGLADTVDQPDKIEFKFNYQPGRSIRQKMVIESSGSMKMPGPAAEQKFAQTMEQVTLLKCRDINPDQSVIMDMTIEDIAMKMIMGTTGFEYDTKKPTAATTTQPGYASMKKIFDGMAGTKFTLTLSPTGQPLKLEGMSQFLKKMKSDLGNELSDIQMKQMIDQMTSAFDDNTMAEQMKTFYRLVPSQREPVSIGEKWENQWSMKLPIIGSMQGKGEYELVGIEKFQGRQCAKIRIKESFTIQPKPNAASKPAAGFKDIMDRMDMKMTTAGSDGLAYWDYQNGELIQLRQTQDMDFKISFKTDPNAKEPAKPASPPMEQKLKTSISVDLIE
jgi:hypothetical protein